MSSKRYPEEFKIEVVKQITHIAPAENFSGNGFRLRAA